MQVKLWTIALFVVASCQVAQCFLSPLRYEAAKVAQIKRSTVTSRTNGLFENDIPTGVPHSFNFQLRAGDDTSALFVERDRATAKLMQEIKNLKSGLQKVVRTMGALLWLAVSYVYIKVLQGNGDALLTWLLYFVWTFPAISLINFRF